MATRQIRIYGDSVLRKKCAPVEEVDDTVRTLIQDMKETMVSATGAGLAAPQVGENVRVIIVRESDQEDNDNILALINPEIIESEGQVDSEEGCLSIPGITETVPRDETISVSFLSEDGDEKHLRATNFLSRVIQHEIDHLNGTLFIDHLRMVKRDMVKRKLKKQLSKKERVKT
jgi:peptide deformylase